MLDEKFSGGADAGEKATFSLTYDKARQKVLGHLHWRKVVSAPFGAILAYLPLYAGGADAGKRFTFLSHTAEPGGRFLVIRIGGKSCRPLWGHPCMLFFLCQAKRAHILR